MCVMFCELVWATVYPPPSGQRYNAVKKDATIVPTILCFWAIQPFNNSKKMFFFRLVK